MGGELFDPQDSIKMVESGSGSDLSSYSKEDSCRHRIALYAAKASIKLLQQENQIHKQKAESVQ